MDLNPNNNSPVSFTKHSGTKIANLNIQQILKQGTTGSENFPYIIRQEKMMTILHPNKVLIVDDEVEQLRTMKLGLRSRHYRVETARNSKEALQRLSDAKDGYDVVVTDYCMPGMSGLQFLKKVKTEYRNLAVIMMTAYGKKQEFIEVLDNPRKGFIEKPFSLDELIREIERVWRLPTRSSDF